MIVAKMMDRPKWLERSTFNNIMRFAWEAMGEYWHGHFRHRHFDRKYAAMYGYATRRPGYEKRKRRMRGHNNPLVWSGASRILTRVRNIRATPKGVTITMNAPTLNLRPKGGRVNMRTELTTVTDAELRTLERVFEMEAERWFDVMQRGHALSRSA